MTWRTQADELLHDHGYRIDRPTRRIARNPRGQRRRRRFAGLRWAIGRMVFGCASAELVPVPVRIRRREWT